MKPGIVQFYYSKVGGSIRQAFGSLQKKYFADVKGTGTRKKNNPLFAYWDTKAEAFRCFKKFNILSIA